jgi:hypothetical protein
MIMRRIILYLTLLLTLIGSLLPVNAKSLPQLQAAVELDQFFYLPFVLNHYPPVPYNPVLNTITGCDDGSYTVSWTESPVQLADTYTLEEATDSSFTQNLRTVCTPSTLSCDVSGKLPGTFYYRVQGENIYGISSWSATQSAVVLLPAVPTLNPISNPSLNRNYTVGWGAAARATNYTLQEDDNSGFSSPTTVYTGSNTSWNATSKLIGTYYYRVNASGPTGQSGWSGTQMMDLKPILLGQYTDYYSNWTPFLAEMNGLDTFVKGAGNRSSSMIGLFYSPSDNGSWVTSGLAKVWDYGYVPFINLYRGGYTSAQIAGGSLDSDISAWAGRFKTYCDPNSDGIADRFAFIAPFQEMNGDWVSYGLDPTNYILAYKHVQTKFKDQGVPKACVSWVFAPNGWSPANVPSRKFEAYYPGAAYVDAVAISAYNYGYCVGSLWQDHIAVFNPATTPVDYSYYLDRLQTMAPGKPIFISQTATGDYYTPGGVNLTQKSNWLQATYNYFATRSSMAGVVYFNVTDPAGQACHFRMFGVNPVVSFTGYKTAVNASGRFQYISPATLLGEPFYFSSTWR